MYPNISYLASAYFHQDYDLEADTPLGLVEVFREGEDAATADALRTEIFALLASEPTEEDLVRLWLEEARAAYDPTREGSTVRDWLCSVAEALAPAE